MCLLTILPPQTNLTPAQWGNAFSINSDGWGIAYATNGRLIVHKDLTDYSDFATTLADVRETHPDKNLLVHLRMTTHGISDIENTHPFKIHKNLIVAHNGIINTKITAKNRSDTWHYVNNRLKPLYHANPQFLDCPIISETISKEIGGSKLAFLDARGNYKIINESLGQWIDGAWVSAPQYLEPRTYYGMGYSGGWAGHCDPWDRPLSNPLENIYADYEAAREYLLDNPDDALDYIADLQWANRSTRKY